MTRKSSKKKQTSTKQRQSKKPTARTGGKKAASSSAPRRFPVPKVHLSSERKRDLGGVGMVLLGLLTAASLLVPEGQALHLWAVFWRHALGWGIWLFPLWLLALGVGLLLQRRPNALLALNLERGLGLLVLYGTVLAGLHLFFVEPSRLATFAHASRGQGGGYVGALFAWVLWVTVGWAGALVLLLAGAVFGVALVLNRPAATLFQWVPALLRGLAQRWQGWLARRRPVAPTIAVAPMPFSSEVSPPVASPQDKGDAQPTTPAPPEKPPWVLPDVAAMLDAHPEETYQQGEADARARKIEETLALFNAPAKVVEVLRGPTVTLYGVEPGYVESRKGPLKVRVSKIASLADDLALALSAKRVRIQAPVPGKGYVGIEVPNEEAAMVPLRHVIESKAFEALKSPLRFALGKDVAGNAVAADLAAMPHLLIAGATGSGKSVCVNGIITCLLLHNTPDDLRLLLVDPKRVELSGYNGIPHLLAPVVVELERVVGALQWVTQEMERRYKVFARQGVRHIQAYNQKAEKEGREKLPYLVVVIDELADLMMLAPETTERTLTRLAQLARATGIHVIIATQRPSVDVVTGLIKANFPARIAFAVASSVDSRVILDQPGAERLLGRGDMLFMAPDAPEPVRLQGVFVADHEIRRVVNYWRAFGTAGVSGISGVVDAPPPGVPLKQKPIWEEMEVLSQQQAQEDAVPRDPMWEQAVAVVRQEGRASASLLQRRLRIGYTRAARLVENMEEAGIVGPPKPGSGVREVLRSNEEAGEG